MKLRKSYLAVIIVSGSLGATGSFTQAQEMFPDGRESHSEYPSVGDDSTLAPGVPGVTEDIPYANLSGRDALDIEESLAANGYDPGRVDGMMDSDTRSAISEFQRDNDLAVTGIIDPETGQLLGVVVTESS